MQNITIGILGGMGPRATVEFEHRVLGQFTATDQDLPTIISINDGTIPDRSLFLLGSGKSPVPKLVVNAIKLAEMGAEILCLPCNTAHADAILQPLRNVLDIPILDMPHESLDIARQQGAQRVLILGTRGTKLSKVFDDRADNLQCIYPSARQQYFTQNLIADIKQGTTISKLRVEQLKRYINSSSADVALLACTELSLLKDRLQSMPVVDSLDALALATKRHTQEAIQ
jgi:aspartate racemase